MIHNESMNAVQHSINDSISSGDTRTARPGYENPTIAERDTDENADNIYGGPESQLPYRVTSCIFPDARVLDADDLDSFLFELLWLPVSSSFRAMSTTTTSTRNSVSFPGSWILHQFVKKEDIMLLMQLVTLLVTGTSPAAQLLHLEWKNTEADDHLHHPTNRTSKSDTVRSALAVYALWKCLVRIGQRYQQDHLCPSLVELRLHQQQQEQQTVGLEQQPHPSNLDLLALERQEWVVGLVRKLGAWAKLVLWLASWTGVTQTPDLVQWWSGVHLEPQPLHHPPSTGTTRPQSVPQLHINYAHRRWLWKEAAIAMRLLLAGFPLVESTWRPMREQLIRTIVVQPWRRWRATTKSIWKPIMSHSSSVPSTTQMEACPMCSLQPIVVPFQTNCGHTYCYTCLYQQLVVAADGTQDRKCQVCFNTITRASPLGQFPSRTSKTTGVLNR